MADQNSSGDTDLNLAPSAPADQINQSEADVIELFFASEPSPDWPATGLQRRMQSSIDAPQSEAGGK